MERPFYRSLDREFQILGLKGQWVKNFLIIAGAGVLFAVMAGLSTSTGIGIVIAILSLAGGFLICLVLQGKVPSRRVNKYKLRAKSFLLVIRRESISRILTSDPRFIVLSELNKRQ